VSELLAGKRGLVLGVSSKDSVGFHTAEELRGHGAELAVSLRPGRAAFAPELSRLGYLPVELEALQPGSIARAIEQVAGRFGRLGGRDLVRCDHRRTRYDRRGRRSDP